MLTGQEPEIGGVAQAPVQTSPRGLLICRNDGPTLPEKTLVTKLAVVGMSGSGKTQTGRKLAEAMMDLEALR